jgi:hypothetical protein
MERFHALPMSRSAVLTGRTFADLSLNAFVVILMMVVGFLVGWRIHTNVLGLMAGGLLVLLFGYAMSWIFATVGLAVGDPEAAQAAAFPVLAPLVFASNAFVAPEFMPGWLQTLGPQPTGVVHDNGGASANDRRPDHGRGAGSDRLVRGNPGDLRPYSGEVVSACGLSERRNLSARLEPVERMNTT